MTNIPNILADRYASEPMRAIWSPEGRIRAERDLWIAVLKAQRDMGLSVPEEVIAAYEAARDHVDLEAIRRREAVTRHDVKARIEAFCDLAGYEHIHKGMTSRDLTENVEQLQVRRSLDLVAIKANALLAALARHIREYRDLVIVARTHNVAAQPSTLGKRFAMYGEEMLLACRRLDELRQRYPARGMKGAVGTQQDLLRLMDGDADKVAALEDKILAHLGFETGLRNVGQIYPRSLDFETVSTLYQLGCAPSNFAKTLRLMAGHELAGEGFAKGQVGSSAMPHKMNSRSCERVNGFHVILRGYMAMAEGLAGDQWNEGDVSCSVVRRVMLPDSFFAIDGLLETTLVVLNQLEIFPAVIARENQHYLPFLATTTILMEAVKAGAGREDAHEAIKEHAIAVVRDLRSGALDHNDLAQRLADDARIGLDRETIEGIITSAGTFTGLAGAQCDHFALEAEQRLADQPEAAAYQPGDIL